LIKILDCTLRDGGYLNGWNFGKDIIKQTIEALSDSGIDYIEGGFLTDIKIFDENKSLYKDAGLLNKYKTASYSLMLNFGTDTTDLVFNKNIEIRLAFKPQNLSEIKEFCAPYIELGYKISLNPMHIGLYTDDDLKILADITNELMPACLTLVDTMGILTPKKTVSLFDYFNSSVNKNIPLGLHSHDNLNFSKKNIIAIMEMHLNRDIIIDTALNGLSRGGGMFSTEVLADILNKADKVRYNTDKLKTVSNLFKHLTPSDKFKQAYYFSAKNKCHPNYAMFLVEHDCPLNKMQDILLKIPDNHKMNYTEKVIKEIYSK